MTGSNREFLAFFGFQPLPAGDGGEHLPMMLQKRLPKSGAERETSCIRIKIALRSHLSNTFYLKQIVLSQSATKEVGGKAAAPKYHRIGVMLAQSHRSFFRSNYQIKRADGLVQAVSRRAPLDSMY